jgi:hypothetical protein
MVGGDTRGDSSAAAVVLRLLAVALAALSAVVSWTWIPWRVWREVHGVGTVTMLEILGTIPAAAAWCAWRSEAAWVAAAALLYALIALPVGSAVGGPLAVPARLLLVAMFASMLAGPPTDGRKR